jgi:hypothetical protein
MIRIVARACAVAAAVAWAVGGWVEPAAAATRRRSMVKA